MKKLLLSIAIVFLLLSCSTKIKVDLLVYNATIYTVDSSFSISEAMAVKDGKIVETGKTSDLQSKYNAKEKLDAQGKFIYPGFIDAHAHFISYGQSLFTVDLFDSKSMDEVVQRVKGFDSAHPNETWILGRAGIKTSSPARLFPQMKN
jgi:predicted amidohydrolase YtcJ